MAGGMWPGKQKQKQKTTDGIVELSEAFSTEAPRAILALIGGFPPAPPSLSWVDLIEPFILCLFIWSLFFDAELFFTQTLESILERSKNFSAAETVSVLGALFWASLITHIAKFHHLVTLQAFRASQVHLAKCFC